MDVKCLNDFEFLLNRKQLSAWMKNSSDYSNSICFRPKTSSTQPFSSTIQYPQNCKANTMNRLVQQCVFKNLAYTIPIKFGNDSKSLDIMIDLFSPWSWIKSNQCQTCKRDGEDCYNNCSTNDNKNVRTFKCYSKICSLKPRCGEIDLFAEGLSVSGQWMQTSIQIGKQFKIKQQKMLYALQISGQQFLQADGVLGLGLEYQETNIDDDEEEEYEQGSGFLQNIKDKFSTVKKRIFSIYLGEQGKQSIQFGDFDENKVYQFKTHPIKYTNCLKNDQKNDDYFKWKIKIESLELYKFTGETNIVQQEDLDSISNFDEVALISLSTTAFILPEKKLNQLLQIFQSKHNIICASTKKYLYFVLCQNLDSNFDFKNLAIKIMIESQIPIYINPQDLVQDCQINGNKKDCLLNLQQSYNDVTIIGECALKNSYIVMDMDNRRIGFAPSITKYNENIIMRIENLIINFQINIAEELQFVANFYIVIIIIMIGIISLRNIKFVSQLFLILKNRIIRFWQLIIIIFSKICKKIFFFRKKIINKEIELQKNTKIDDTNYQYNINELGYSDIEHEEM